MFIIHYSQSTIHNSLFTIHYLHRGSLSNSETIVYETSFYIMKTIYYLQSTIYYLQFTIHYLHCRSLYRSHSTLPIKLLNSSLSSRFLALKFFREKGITDVIQDHMHSYMTGTSCIYNRCICITPPGRRSVSGTWGSLKATASMAHAARRRGDPWSGSGAGLGER